MDGGLEGVEEKPFVDEDEEGDALQPDGSSAADGAGGYVVVIWIGVGLRIAHGRVARIGRFAVGEELWLSRHLVLCLTVTERRGIVSGVGCWRGCGGG